MGNHPRQTKRRPRGLAPEVANLARLRVASLLDMRTSGLAKSERNALAHEIIGTINITMDELHHEIGH